MDAATVALLVIVGVIVAAIALHLIIIAASLRKITTTLGSLKGGVQAIKGQSDPIGAVVGGLAGDVAAIDDDLEGLLVLVGEAQAGDQEPAAPPPRRPAPATRSTVSVAEVEAPSEINDGDFNDGDFNDGDFNDDGIDEEPVAPRPTMREAVARARAGSRA